MKISHVYNYHFNRAVFLNEIKNIVLENGGQLVNKRGQKLEPLKIKNLDYETDYYITHYEGYISYRLNDYYYEIILDDKPYVDSIYAKTKVLKNKMVHETRPNNTYLPMTYKLALRAEEAKTIDELKNLAQLCVDELKDIEETKIVIKQEAKIVPNTYNDDTHIEIIQRTPKYQLKQILL